MWFGDVAIASHRLAATSKRLDKRAVVADLIRAAEGPSTVGLVVSYLIGQPRQGRLGVGWSALADAGLLTQGEHEPLVTDWSVEDADGLLDELAALGGPGSQARRADLLRQVADRCSPFEGRFFARLLLGELRQGALGAVVLEGVAVAAGVAVDDVRRAAMLLGSVPGAAALAIEGGTDALVSVGLAVGRAIEPMLAATAASVSAAVRDLGRVSVEWKLDGARVQVHRSGEAIAIFTRNLRDIGERLPGVRSMALAFPADRFVLDGEVLGIDEEGRPGVFQETMSRFSADEPQAGAGLQAFFFDLLHLDGRDLIDEALSVRQALLDGLVGDRAVPRIVTDDPEAAEVFAAEALHRGHEGVMVKAIESRYEAGRRGSNWLKVKPVRTLDLVVLGAEWGHGRRRGWLSNLHLGARADDGTFVMVGKTFKGLTDELLRFQTERFPALAAEQHPWGLVLRPELVVEIALDGVQSSRRYPGGVALRFARVRGYRPDRDAASADTIDAVRALLPAPADE